MEFLPLINKHLSSSSISGAAVLLRTGACVYSYGALTQYQDQNWMPMVNLFFADVVRRDNPPQLTLELPESVKFTAFNYSEHSFYATSAGRLNGLVICRIPFGILVCIICPPVLMSTAVSTAERIASMLRT